MPFDRKTPIGYALSYIIETSLLVVDIHVAACALGILLSFYGITMTSVETLQRKFHNVNENFKIEKNNLEIQNELCATVRLHSEAKELSKISNNFFFILLSKVYGVDF